MVKIKKEYKCPDCEVCDKEISYSWKGQIITNR